MEYLDMDRIEWLKDFFRARNLRILFAFGIVYVALSFGLSFMGFLAPEPPVALREHISTDLLVELGGHFLFGAVAAIPFLDVDLIFLSGVFAMLIDSDHVLDALGFYVSGRPDHSFFYAVLSGLVLYYLARRLNLGGERQVKFAFLGAVVVFAHISYDIFASYVLIIGKGYYFPLFDPFNFATVSLSFDYWIVFEVAGLGAALCGLYASRRIKGKGRVRQS